MQVLPTDRIIEDATVHSDICISTSNCSSMQDLSTQGWSGHHDGMKSNVKSKNDAQWVEALTVQAGGPMLKSLDNMLRVWIGHHMGL